MTTPTTDQQARDYVRAALLAIVPDADFDAMDPAADLRDELELDSLDFLAFAEQLSKRTGLRIDEEDYRHMRTFAACVAFLVARSSTAART